MSTHVVVSYKVKGTESTSADFVYEFTRNLLQKNLDTQYQTILESLRKLNNEEKISLKEKFGDFEHHRQNLFSSYSIGDVIGNRGDTVFDTIIKEYSSFSLELKREIIRLKEIEDENNSMINDISKKISELVQYTLFSEKDDIYAGLLRKFYTLQQIESIYQKNKQLKTFFTEFEALYKNAREINSSIKPLLLELTTTIQTMEKKGVAETFQNDFDSIRNQLENANNQTNIFKKAEACKNVIKIFSEFERKHHIASEISIPPSFRNNRRESQKKKKTKLTNEEISRIKDEILHYYKKAQVIDDHLPKELQKSIAKLGSEESPQKLEMIRLSVLLHYGKKHDEKIWTDLYKDGVRLLILHNQDINFGIEIQREIDETLNSPTISKESYLTLMEKMNTRIRASQKQLIKDFEKIGVLIRIIQKLSDMGYSLSVNADPSSIAQDILGGQSQLFDTKWPDFKLFVAQNQFGELIIKLVKPISTEKEKFCISDYDHMRNIEIGKKWCEHFDIFQKSLKATGVEIEEIIRIEPEDREIEFIIAEGNKEPIDKVKNKGQLYQVQQEDFHKNHTR